ncbi:Pyrophosphate--fructose 6-phosphate 1-phosphotransferase subunit beta [Glycine max]|nr:Pyrophosphate--fructose 6-phosphate 1-phosphotransferase subunit beta [Glycine max]
MTEGDFAINGGFPGARVTPPSVTGRFAAVYSEVQNSCIDHELPLPSVLKSPFIIVDSPQSSAAGNPEEIAKPFPKLFGQPSAALVSSDSHAPHANRKLKIGVVLSGVQPPDGHNVIFGIFDYLQDLAEGSTLYGFRGGPAGIMKCKYIELTSDYIYPSRNQVYFPISVVLTQYITFIFFTK